MSVEENKASSRRLLEECFSRGALSVADELVGVGAVDHDPATPERMRSMRGPQLMKQMVSMYRAAFPDLVLTVEDQIGEGDRVVTRWRSEGTHRGELEGLAPTNMHATVTGITIDRYEDGKVAETWTQWDNLGLARQLGAAPPEGSMGERIGLTMQHLMARRMRSKAPAGVG
jgi:predicted ester cyclase